VRGFLVYRTDYLLSMKYIISESKLEKTIVNYLDELFPLDDINWHHPYEYNDETGEEFESDTLIEYYRGDFDEGNDICFRYYFCEYFNQGSYAQDICPTVSLEIPYERILDGYFGDTWREPFKQWFEERFELPVKTIDN
jgi:hypothetical protein